jgi:hypothetical protein
MLMADNDTDQSAATDGPSTPLDATADRLHLIVRTSAVTRPRGVFYQMS